MAPRVGSEGTAGGPEEQQFSLKLLTNMYPFYFTYSSQGHRGHLNVFIYIKVSLNLLIGGGQFHYSDLNVF